MNRTAVISDTATPPRPWAEMIRGGGLVAGLEPPFCEGIHQHPFPQHAEDVAHYSPKVELSTEAGGRPVCLVHAYVLERPFDSSTEIGDGPKMLASIAGEEEPRVLDLDAARVLHADVESWLTTFGALLDQFAAAVREDGAR